MLHISLFSGIGGFDLAAQWAGWTNVASCEIAEFPRKVLQHHFPQAYHHDDIHTLTYQILNDELEKRFGKEWRSDDIVLSGGFPCQPYSLAGKRQGKDDDRHLWPEMLRVIREVQPRWVVGENVFGLVNWNGGLVFDEVQSDLEAAGYEVQAFILPACGVNAPHRRDRVWFVAYSDSGTARSFRSCREFKKSWNYRFLQQDKWRKEAKQYYRFYEFPQFTPNAKSFRINRTQKLENSQKQSREWRRRDANDISKIYAENRCSDAPNPKGKQSEWMQFEQRESCEQKQGQSRGSYSYEFNQSRIPNWNDFPAQSPVCSGNDGISERLDGITFPKWRNESIKAYGNAVVPQVVYQIFKAINNYNDLG